MGSAEVRLWPRTVECAMACAALAVLSVPMAIVALTVKLTSPGPVLYWSHRVGVNNSLFRLPKFRTMCVDAPVVATHLLSEPRRHITRIGLFLRKSSLDELPQIFSILRGEITFVGPRPALFNQDDLIAMRTECGVHLLVPGLTGWAQVNGRDSLSIPDKVALDREYLHRRSRMLDLRILLLTVWKVLRLDDVKH